MGTRRKHEDTTVSLHPLTFDEAIAKLAQAKRKDSQAEGSGSTTEPDRESARRFLRAPQTPPIAPSAPTRKAVPACLPAYR